MHHEALLILFMSIRGARFFTRSALNSSLYLRSNYLPRLQASYLQNHSLQYCRRNISIIPTPLNSMTTAGVFEDATPSIIKESKGLHLLTMNTPNGQKVQILLEELKDIYPDLKWSNTILNIMTNVQKEDWFLRLDPNGRIPVLVDSTKSPPFTVHETSAELLYLLKEYDSKDEFGFKDELVRNQCLQWMFFWHGSGAPYQGQLNHFGKFAKDKIPCMSLFLGLYVSCSRWNTDYRAQMPSTASATRRCVYMACSRSTSLESTQDRSEIT